MRENAEGWRLDRESTGNWGGGGRREEERAGRREKEKGVRRGIRGREIRGKSGGSGWRDCGGRR